VACAAAPTTISGTVLAPTPPVYGAPDPISGALVYVPNGPVVPFPAGVACDRCDAEVTGAPLVAALTGPDGTFTLVGAPAGPAVPLVIQLGRWRRQVVIPSVTACQDNPLPPELTRLPRHQGEGDIPLMAMVTGDVDALECVLRKVGIDDREFTLPAPIGGTGRVQLFVANGATLGPATPLASALVGSAAELARYDLVLFACEGYEHGELPEDQQRVVDYADAGGRVFATHFSYAWLWNIEPFNAVVDWHPSQRPPHSPLTGVVDQSFPKGQAFAAWLGLVGAASAPGQIVINEPRHDLDGVEPPTQSWISSSNPSTVQQLTFNTPVDAPAAQQCGRVVYSDFHVEAGSLTGALTFPGSCAEGPLTPQEKVLEFMLFDLGSCIAPDQPPSCSLLTCAAQGLACGPGSDGCGGLLDCGACDAPETCGGGGVPGACGQPPCAPLSCAAQGLACGPAGDGCGGALDCGACVAPATCGGGGVPGACGRSACPPRSCAEQDVECGPAGDGCGGLITCGGCRAPDTCGGGGVPGRCGTIL
jgi:hypothetical protein